MSRTLLIVTLLFTGCSSSSKAESKDTETSAADAVRKASQIVARPIKALSKEDEAFKVGREYARYEAYLALSQDKARDPDGKLSAIAMQSLAYVQSTLLLGITRPQGPGKRDQLFLELEKKHSTKIAQTFGLGYEVARQGVDGKYSGKYPHVAYLEGLARKLELPAPIVEKAADAARAPSVEVLTELGDLLDRHYN